MGYRSSVAYRIYFTEQDKDKFITFICEAKDNPDIVRVFDHDFFSVEVNEGNTEIDFEAVDVKWYDSYPDVIAHLSLLELAKTWRKDGIGVEFKFCRVGEDLEDAEEWCSQGYDYDAPYIARSISWG